MSSRLTDLVAAVDSAADPLTAQQLVRYFQVRPGGYGEGDTFIGVKLSELRRLTKPYVGEPLLRPELAALLTSHVHEHRLAAVVLLDQYARRAERSGDRDRLREVYELFMSHLDSVDNWDLVDAGAAGIVGGYLLERPRDALYELVEHDCVWRRRVAIVATHRFLRAGQSADTYALTARVVSDPQDLIHKAAGWMLREAGKLVDEAELRRFLDQHAADMPRTMLRYAIERMPPKVRGRYLAVKPSAHPSRLRGSGSGPASAAAARSRPGRC